MRIELLLLPLIFESDDGAAIGIEMAELAVKLLILMSLRWFGDRFGPDVVGN